MGLKCERRTFWSLVSFGWLVSCIPLRGRIDSIDRWFVVDHDWLGIRRLVILVMVNVCISKVDRIETTLLCNAGSTILKRLVGTTAFQS